MERKIATIFTNKVRALVSKKFNKSYSIFSDKNYFYYPNFDDYNGFKDGCHLSASHDNKSYELVSEQEFLDYFNESKVVNRKMGVKSKKTFNEQFKDFIDIKFEKPIHYAQTKSGMDVFDVARDWNINNPELFSALKYILRCGKKDSESMEVTKAINCLTKYLKVLDNE